MNPVQTLNVVLNTLTTYGFSVLAVLGAVVALSVAYLVFTFGWKCLILDESLMIGGYYVRKLPVVGYNRWRSQKWNSINKPWDN